MSGFEKDIGTINFGPMILSLEDRAKDPTLIFKKTGLDKEYLMSNRNFVDLPTGIIIFNAVKEILGEKDPMVFYDLGLDVVKNQNIGEILKLGRALGNVEESVRFIPRFNRKFNDIFEMGVYGVQDNTAIVTIDYKKRQYDNHWIFDQSPWNQGAIAGIPYEWALPNMAVEEAVNRFSLQEIFRDYEFMGHAFELDEGSRAFLNGKLFAVPALLKTEKLVSSPDKISRLNPMMRKGEFADIITNKGYEAIKDFRARELNGLLYGMAITEDTRVSDMLTLKEGQIYAHPSCRIYSRLNIKWNGTKKVSRYIRDSTIGRIFYVGHIIEGYDEELQRTRDQQRVIIRQRDELQDYATSLEDKVKERTEQLQEEKDKVTAYATQLEATNSKLINTQDQLVRAKVAQEQVTHTSRVAHEIASPLRGAKNSGDSILYNKEKDSKGNIIEVNRVRQLEDILAGIVDIISDARDKKIPYDQLIETVIPKIMDVDSLLSKINESVLTMYQGSSKALGLADGLMNYTTISEYQKGNEQISIASLFNEYCKTHYEILNMHSIKVINDLPKSILVNGDTKSINSIFENIFTNAIKAIRFDEKGNKDRKITLGYQADGNEAIISISDTGKGIEQDKIQEIFKPLYSDYATEGTGLGLAIAKEFTEVVYKGNIWVESKLSQGSTFFVKLPIISK